MSYTVDDLITRIKRRAVVPSSQPAYSNSTLIEMATEEMLDTVCPVVIGYNEGFFLTSTDFEISSDTTDYPIPQSAIGSVLYDLQVIDGNNIRSVPIITTPIQSEGIEGFYLAGNSIRFTRPQNYEGLTLRMYYFRRPSTLIGTSSTARVTAISGSIATVGSVPPGWSSTVTELDIVSHQPGFEIIFEGVTAAISGNDLTFSSLEGVQVGDYISATGYSPIPQIPQEAHSLLAQAVVVQIAMALGSADTFQKEKMKYEEIKLGLLNLMNPRIKGEPFIIDTSGGFF